MNKGSSKEKMSICRLRHSLGRPCQDCIYFETRYCKKTFKAKENKHESTGKESSRKES